MSLGGAFAATKQSSGKWRRLLRYHSQRHDNYSSPLNALSKTDGISVRPKNGRNSSLLADCNSRSTLDRNIKLFLTIILLFLPIPPLSLLTTYFLHFRYPNPGPEYDLAILVLDSHQFVLELNRCRLATFHPVYQALS
jgi:hypothetical protein